MPDQDNQNYLNDEILIRDEFGNFQIYSQGQLKPYQPSKIPVRQQAVSIQPIDTGMEEPMLQPPPPVVRKSMASFYFHPEDEEEVAKFKDRGGAIATGKLYSLDKIVKKINESYQLHLAEQLFTRLRNIIFSFLRDRRTLLDFKEALVRSEINGGMNFSLEVTEKIASFLTEIKQKVALESGLVIDEKEETELLTKEKITKLKPSETAGLKVSPRPIPRVAPRPLVKQAEEARPLRAVRFQRPVKAGKMSDVKKDYRLYGPVEELGSLDLETFRRLDATTAEIIEKVIKKVESLIHESLSKKAAGIKAWRSSPLYKMYLAVGQASMEHRISVAEIINQYHNSGKEILTLEEFEAITDINRRLRF